VVGKKVYLQPRGTVINGICDLIEIQNGKITLSDTPNGIVHFQVIMYGSKWELKFIVADIGQNRSFVRLEIESERSHEKFMHREFTLLDTFFFSFAEIEMAK
jgi:hypothetical protein